MAVIRIFFILVTVLVTSSLLFAEPRTDISSGELKANGVRHVDVNEAAILIETHSEIVVLDVRTADEFISNHLEGAQNIDYNGSDFSANIAGLDKTKTYLLHCHSGRRSGLAVKVLREAGIENVIHMDGGIQAWKAAGFNSTE